MINYIIQVVLFQVLFLAIYDFFLSKETFFTKNRWYLLSTPIVSFLLPLVQIPSFQKAIPQEYVTYLPEIILSPERVIQEASWYQSVNYLDVFFLVGVVLFSILFATKLVKIIKLIRAYKLRKKEGFTLVLIPKQSKAFSFFNYIFLGEEIPDTQKEQIIAHELVHSKQKHSFDLLLFELLKIMMWFNPMIYSYQKRITLVHEYISDAVSTKSEPKDEYINQLLSNFFQVENIAFINQFYKQTLIKKRIIMMKKKQSKKMNQLKYLVLIPVLLSMLFYTSCSSSRQVTKTAKAIEITEEVIEVVAVEEVEVSIESVSFMKIEKGPTFPGCDTGDKDCFSKNVQKHFSRNFNSKLPNSLGLSEGKKRVFIGFKVAVNGGVVDVKVRAPHPEIKAEVLRVMKTLPKMLPGQIKGENVAVNYTIPFTLLIDKVPSSSSSNVEPFSPVTPISPVASLDGSVNFMSIETAPTFPGCDTGDKDCFSKMVQKHFGRNFNAKLPNSLGLSAGKKRVFIGFKVAVNGDIVNVQARAPHVKIKEEVIRVMRSLPKMIPGKQDGKNVVVNYNIPFALLVDDVTKD
ncbi:BlaR1 peptidase M56 [Polaribacter sp.]|nr:BlaR1 peptidase M56 [Polaribacter sp.]MDC1237902.1 BlaR1 peptidase M56 [Polaribacter sp.]